ncbi:MAG TPA: glutathione S-transferase family protein [Povalibacter sp.]|nr:glutathione S-transferase family protein [Povalibacter sp.]
MIRLYFHNTPNSAKVAMLLEEMELPYQLVPVDTHRGEQHGGAYRAINPNGKVPAIDDDGVMVFDSNAILLHLAEKSGRFLGTPAQRPAVLSWLMFVASGLGPFCGQAVHFSRVHTDSTYATNRYKREAERHYQVLNTRLSSSAYLAGNEYTIADIAAWGWINLIGFVLNDDTALKRWPHLERWFNRISARPAATRARAAGQDLKFKTAFDEETMRALFPQNFPAQS